MCTKIFKKIIAHKAIYNLQTGSRFMLPIAAAFSIVCGQRDTRRFPLSASGLMGR